MKTMPRFARPAALLLVLTATLAFPPTARAIDTDFLFQWGSPGTGAGQFNQPSAVAIGPGDDVYVLDEGNQRIQKFDTDGNFLTQWTSARPFQGSLQSIAVGHDGSVYVQATYWIQKFDPNGVYLINWGPTSGSSGQSHELAIDDLGNVCVTYQENGVGKTRRFTPAGASIAGGFGAGFEYYGTAFDSDGNAFYASFGPSGNTPTIFRRTSGGVLTSWNATARRLTVDVLGNVYASDPIANQIRIFTNGGASIRAFGTPGGGPGQFNFPLGMVVSSGGRIYVADFNNHRIQVFGSLATPVRPSSWGRLKAGYRN